MQQKMKQPVIAVAPMVNVTDRHCRYFLRQITPRIALYTEMIAASAVLRGDPDLLLGHDVLENPLVLQLGGNEPGQLAEAASIGESYGYDAINLNVGCPSERVQNGKFGACLMLEPDIVARCIGAMRRAVSVPVTVKTRIGVDGNDSYEFLHDFVGRLVDAGCEAVIVHARKAYLNGLSPAENRTIPPLRYDFVYRIKDDFPGVHVAINGGVRSLEEITAHLRRVDGVMIGRKAIEDPCFLAEVESGCLGAAPHSAGVDREAVVQRMSEYAEHLLCQGVRLHSVTRHMLGLYHGVPGARRWRRFLAENAARPDAGPEVLRRSLDVFASRDAA